MSGKAQPIAYHAGSFIHLLEIDSDALQEKLKPRIYELESTDKSPVLKVGDNIFTLPNRIYGTVIHTRKQLIMDTFMNNPRKPLGAMGIGQKGTGKTEQMQLICNEAIAKGIPVIVIRKPCRREDIELLIKFCKNCVIFFDEYGKVYKDHDENSEKMRNELLTLFSDTSLGHVLFLLTDNDTRNFNDFLLERPTRIYYRFDYVGCGNDVVADIAKSFKLTNEITDWLLAHAKRTNESIDGILAICKEGKNAKTVDEFIEVFQVLNVIKPKYDKLMAYSTDLDVKITVNGDTVTVSGPDLEESHVINKILKRGRFGSRHLIKKDKLEIEIVMAESLTDPGESYTCDVQKRMASPW